MTIDFTVTLKTLALGNAGATTGLYARTYTDSTIDLIASDFKGGYQPLGLGWHDKVACIGYSDSVLHQGDRIVDQQSQTWEVTSVFPYQVGDVVAYYQANLALIEGLGVTPEPQNPPMPPEYSGIFGLSGFFQSNRISEEGHIYNQMATEVISETVTITEGAMGEETITEEGAVELAPTEWFLTTIHTPDVAYPSGTMGSLDIEGDTSAGAGAGSGTTDSYVEANQSGALNIQAVHPSASTSISAVAQSFTGDGNYLESCQFYLKKNNAPVGNLRAALYAHTGTFGSTGKPTGDPLDYSYDTVAMAGLGAAYALTTFHFGNITMLTSGTKYCIVLYAESAATLNTTHYVIVGTDTSAPTHGGIAANWKSSAWAVVSGTDTVFYVAYNGTGTAITVTATEGQYWAFKTTGGWLADGVAANGTFNAVGNENAYAFPAQNLGTTHFLQAIFQYGWELTVSSTGPGTVTIGGVNAEGTDQIPDGENSQTYTATVDAGDPNPHHLDGWYLDDVKVSSSGTYAAPAQTAGTSHTLVAVFHEQGE